MNAVVYAVLSAVAMRVVGGLMEDISAGRIAVATRGVRFPAELADLLTWATYNHADRRSIRELYSLPWRSYTDVSDVADQISRTRQDLAAHTQADL